MWYNHKLFKVLKGFPTVIFVITSLETSDVLAFVYHESKLLLLCLFTLAAYVMFSSHGAVWLDC